MGYERTDLYYRGHLSASPHPALLHDIEFAWDEEWDREKVVITFNFGLLSCRSPLPSYFVELLTNVETEAPLGELLRFLDHQLIEVRCQSYQPQQTFAAWTQTQADLLRLSGLGSPSTVCSLLSHVFPELDVTVTRGAGTKLVQAHAVRVGRAMLGDCAFGSYATEPADGLHVTLRCREPESHAGVPWRLEAGDRLQRIVLPLLREAGTYLVVELLLLGQGKYLQLDGESSIGYEPLPGGRWRPHRVTLFRGRLSPGSLEPILARG
jgi:hypothetical protein